MTHFFRFQCHCRGWLARQQFEKRKLQEPAALVIQQNLSMETPAKQPPSFAPTKKCIPLTPKVLPKIDDFSRDVLSWDPIQFLYPRQAEDGKLIEPTIQLKEELMQVPNVEPFESFDHYLSTFKPLIFHELWSTVSSCMWILCFVTFFSCQCADLWPFMRKPGIKLTRVQVSDRLCTSLWRYTALCLRSRHTPNNWEIAVQRRCYTHVWHFHILRVNRKTIEWTWAEPFEMNVKISSKGWCPYTLHSTFHLHPFWSMALLYQSSLVLIIATSTSLASLNEWYLSPRASWAVMAAL